MLNSRQLFTRLRPTLSVLVLVLGGASTAVAQGTWSPLGPMPAPRAYPAACAAGSAIYAFGGYDGTHADTVVSFDPATGLWSPRAPMPVQRTGAACAESGGLVYVLGGTINAGTALTGRVDVYDPQTDTWGSPVAPMPTLRSNVGVAAIDGIIYVAGGSGPFDVATVEAYDPASDTWETKAPMPTARSYVSAGVIDGRLYVAGGANGNTQLEVYDPATDTWTSQAPLPTARFIPGAGVLGGKFYVIGGATASTLTVVEVFDPATGAWSAGPAMPTDRYGFGSVVLGGTLYAFGGATFTGGFTVLPTVEALSLAAEATPRELTMDLLNAVRSLALARGMSTSFESKLQKALVALESPLTTAEACDALQAFVNHARAQSGKHLTVPQAGQLIADATAIRGALSCQ